MLPNPPQSRFLSICVFDGNTNPPFDCQVDPSDDCDIPSRGTITPVVIVVGIVSLTYNRVLSLLLVENVYASGLPIVAPK